MGYRLYSEALPNELKVMQASLCIRFENKKIFGFDHYPFFFSNYKDNLMSIKGEEGLRSNIETKCVIFNV